MQTVHFSRICSISSIAACGRQKISMQTVQNDILGRGQPRRSAKQRLAQAAIECHLLECGVAQQPKVGCERRLLTQHLELERPARDCPRRFDWNEKTC